MYVIMTLPVRLYYVTCRFCFARIVRRAGLSVRQNNLPVTLRHPVSIDATVLVLLAFAHVYRYICRIPRIVSSQDWDS